MSTNDDHRYVPAHDGPASCTGCDWESRRTGIASTTQHEAHRAAAAAVTAADQTPATDSERVEEVLAEMRDCFRVERADDNVLVPVSHLRIVHDEVTRLTALLAEQAATIERLDLAAQETDWPAVSRALAVARALGSQRTEGQG